MTVRYILFSLTAFSLYAIWYLSYTNGTLKLNERAITFGKLQHGEKLSTLYTGIEPVDQLLSVFTTFFYPAVDGHSPGLLLHAVLFSGTFGASWILTVLESWRSGNIGTVVAYPIILGLLGQLLTFAFATPLISALQLGHSITAERPDADNIRVPRAVLTALPVAMTIGYLVPSLLMILPAPTLVSVESKQMFIALWQPWPIYVSILTPVLSFALSPYLDHNHRASLNSLRWVYGSAFLLGAGPHIVAEVVSLAAWVVPILFPEGLRDVFHPANMLGLPLPWSSMEVQTMAEGTRIFLVWDYLIGSAGFLIWAIKLHHVAQARIMNTARLTHLCLKAFLLTAIVGPAAAAVRLVWERDELIFAEEAKKNA
ncbi:uncharacterized protein N7498_008699 [Penicillium cinerascens]|uniref:Uncharacterized protein n=1 Tax=Penicillium cinerascens TaxID=70096 RepID=A0A9W9JFV9_9EURO|nr:uncharacterized protein N7498_008699 [Penicillium cinerascens]KAJ5195261.1 hypothetical protein N7498_008699 [Penicillium cinerascens]